MAFPISVAFLGFGEAAQAFCEGWGADRAFAVAAYDRKTDNPDTAQAKRRDYHRYAVTDCSTPEDALANASVVLSLVTADQALAAASVGACLQPGTLFLDCNSVAPNTKMQAARHVEAQGGRYVDVAVMSPVRPALIRVPLLVSGPHADAGDAVLKQLGFSPRIAGNAIGAASAVKMIRSIMIKGLEALTAECLLSARAAGVDDVVLGSLDESFPGWNWSSRADYNLDRMLVHGERRAAEMREAAATAGAFGQSGSMAQATADWQDRLGALCLSPPEGFAAKADLILSATGTASR
jgi:3-hydroxyisobutyrate dehydrogenase-like beta-hydroxyacid dehydrogenase